jgi:Beta-lactamase superfamily domain
VLEAIGARTAVGRASGTDAPATVGHAASTVAASTIPMARLTRVLSASDYHSSMQLTKFGHSCLLVESANARILVDPGSFTSGVAQLDGLTALLITHSHADHLEVDTVMALVDRNPTAPVIADSASAAILTGRGLDVRVVADGDTFDVGLPVTVHGAWHAEIHPDLPPVPNPGRDVPALAVPVGAPWMRVADAIDYLRALTPPMAITVHEKVLAAPQISYGLIERLAPSSRIVTLADGERIDL